MGDATPDQVIVLLGGHPAPVLYAGPAPGVPGVDQINFQVPEDPAIPDGCSVALEVDVAGFRSNFSRLSKSSAPGPCPSAINLSLDQMTQLDAGGTVNDASFFIFGSVTPQMDGSFVRTESVTALSDRLNSRILGPGPLFADDIFYSCARPVLLAPVTGADAFQRGGDLNIGPQVVLTGPSTSNTVPFLAPWLYELDLPVSPPAESPDRVAPSYFAPGTWQVTGGGNSVMASYQSQLIVPSAIQLTNYSSLQSIDATNDLLVQWNSDGYNPGDVVTLSVTIASLTPIAVCHAHASDGQITVPASLIQFPNATSASFTISVQGSLTPVSISLNDESTLPASFAYAFEQSFTATIQSR
jgi:hypothetical protein